ncbi:hypothetical protein L3X38_037813 [Prunus dulcis]|uniref:Uncharacterized protein n=1 Tax=Prunus dulcis TaxID=3755 RepID=A0AAD4V3V6_PRUDU|nr:hypothetical protein L3X38_037813 [Prunus dulcis]
MSTVWTRGAFGPWRPFPRRDAGFGLWEETTGSVGHADRAFKVLRYGVPKVSIQVFVQENVPIERYA